MEMMKTCTCAIFPSILPHRKRKTIAPPAFFPEKRLALAVIHDDACETKKGEASNTLTGTRPNAPMRMTPLRTAGMTDRP